MYIAIITLIILVCVLLGLIVLAQNPKGGGLSSQFGAGGAANLMGVKRTGDLLEKLTWGFAIGLIVLALGTHVLQGSATAGGPARSVNQQRALETRIPTGPAAPAAPAPGQAAQPRTDTPPAPATTPTTPSAQ
ncbi:preprotein translocase subunit SecG [Hymenobacter crusticola]|uniref:Protein-export membrane protein SecG n=1 Tax=Hymenobacter crusticola TaxID=1770526 RepID=A0A243W924_9BACT|nr:preprotein translocase subunit SecG [Hymenobacter crusticola]OUJ71767.1 preprotein translocase subunit SecG [Hymenobacter crusticola]